MRKVLITVIGGFLTVLGAVLIIVPGPAFLFLPIGLAILSLEYQGARKLLKKTQKLMRISAVKMDAMLAKMRK